MVRILQMGWMDQPNHKQCSYLGAKGINEAEREVIPYRVGVSYGCVRLTQQKVNALVRDSNPAREYE